MIRKIEYKDLKRINELGKKYDKKFVVHFPMNDYLFNDYYISNCFDEDGIIKGFIIATILYEVLEIHLIYVDETYRRSGIAQALLNDLLKKVEVEKSLLEVSVYNEGAVNLYKKLGYKRINTRHNYYNTIDAYVMEMKK